MLGSQKEQEKAKKRATALKNNLKKRKAFMKEIRSENNKQAEKKEK